MLITLHPIVSALLLVGTVCSVVWIFSEVFRRYSVKGSRRRWYWAGIERAFRYPALGYLVLSGLVWVAYSQYGMAAIDGASVALWVLLWKEKQSGDQDDDFWSNVQKKLQDLFAPKAAHAAL